MLLQVQYVTFKAVKKVAVGAVWACSGLSAQTNRTHTPSQ
jgi:hypothetical protein